MIQTPPATWDRVVDVVVVGSGGAALTAATLAADGGAEVLVLEKADMVGGTTAVSGGVMWLPRNHHMAEAGVEDTKEEALAYLRRLTMGHEHDPALLEAFVDAAPEMLAYLEANTPVEMAIVPMMPDYYFPWDIPGKKPPGRSVEPVPYSFGEHLPEWRHRIVTRGTLMSLGSYTTLAEDQLGLTDETLGDERARREAADIRPKGAALIGRLFRGLLDRGVETLLSTSARELFMSDGAVVGVQAESSGTTLSIGARKGVVLACGGFEWNPEMVHGFIGYEVFALSPPNNVGDGLAMASEAGAQLANMDSYWGTPVMFDPGIERDGKLVPQFEGGRNNPGNIVVNRHGERFANEGLPYNDFPKAFHNFDGTAIEFPNEAPAWMIFDHELKESVQILSIVPGKPAPEWVPQAPTIRELAAKIGIDPDALEATVDRFNKHALAGEDPDFGRHEVAIMGVPPLRPVDQAPFYALQLYPGTLGTNGGPKLNANGQVLSHRGQPIPGLYAAGNTAANVFGWAYPSGGGTIANGTVFGYLAGRHVAAQPARQLAT